MNVFVCTVFFYTLIYRLFIRTKKDIINLLIIFFMNMRMLNKSSIYFFLSGPLTLLYDEYACIKYIKCVKLLPI